MQDRGLDKGHPPMYSRKQYARVVLFSRAYCSAHTPAGSAREAHKGSTALRWLKDACNWSKGLKAPWPHVIMQARALRSLLPRYAV